jgi:RND family efflux transporter MFP subunit
MREFICRPYRPRIRFALYPARRRRLRVGLDYFSPAGLSVRPTLKAASLLVGLVFVASTMGCRQEAEIKKEPTPVRIALVQSIDATSSNTYSANIQPYQQVDLSFKSNGYLASIKQIKDADGHIRNIDQGDYVTKGTVLAVVQQDEYQDKLAQAKAALARSQAENERAKLSFDRISKLYAAGAATKPDYDDSNAQVESTTASVANAKAQVSEAQLALGYCEMRAPFDSWVLKRNVDVGTLVGPATNGFTLADTRSVKAVFGVPDTAMGQVKLGSPETVTTEALPGAFSGHVTSISAAADPKSRVYSVEVRIDNPGNRLKAGMIASITLGDGRANAKVNVVPLTAVIRSPAEKDGFAVYVADGPGDTPKVRTQDVTLGDTYGNNIAVLSGLNVSDRVVTSGTNMIRAGDQVRVIP